MWRYKNRGIITIFAYVELVYSEQLSVWNMEINIHKWAVQMNIHELKELNITN